MRRGRIAPPAAGILDIAEAIDRLAALAVRAGEPGLARQLEAARQTALKRAPADAAGVAPKRRQAVAH